MDARGNVSQQYVVAVACVGLLGIFGFHSLGNAMDESIAGNGQGTAVVASADGTPAVAVAAMAATGAHTIRELATTDETGRSGTRPGSARLRKLLSSLQFRHATNTGSGSTTPGENANGSGSGDNGGSSGGDHGRAESSASGSAKGSAALESQPGFNPSPRTAADILRFPAMNNDELALKRGEVLATVAGHAPRLYLQLRAALDAGAFDPKTAAKVTDLLAGTPGTLVTGDAWKTLQKLEDKGAFTGDLAATLHAVSFGNLVDALLEREQSTRDRLLTYRDHGNPLPWLKETLTHGMKRALGEARDLTLALTSHLTPRGDLATQPTEALEQQRLQVRARLSQFEMQIKPFGTDAERAEVAALTKTDFDLMVELLARHQDRVLPIAALTPATAQRLQKTQGDVAVDFALQQLGKPYVFATRGPDTFDCSGLTSASWAVAGVEMPAYSGAQWDMFPKVAREELRPGDLIIFGDPTQHVGMYIGNDQYVQAPHTGDVVKISELAGSNYYGAVRPQ